MRKIKVFFQPVSLCKSSAKLIFYWCKYSY